MEDVVGPLHIYPLYMRDFRPRQDIVLPTGSGDVCRFAFGVSSTHGTHSDDGWLMARDQLACICCRLPLGT